MILLHLLSLGNALSRKRKSYNSLIGSEIDFLI